MKKIIFALVCVLVFVKISIAMNLADIRTEVRKYVNDPSTDTAKQRWSDAEINTIINQGHIDACQQTWCLYASTHIALTKDTTYYSLPDDMFLSARVVYGGTTILEETTINTLDRDDENWLSTSTGVPTNYYINMEKTKIGLYPVPSSAYASSIDIFYVKVPEPDALSSDTDVPFDNVKKFYPYHYLLVYFSVSHLLAAEGKPNANFWYRLYDRGVKSMATKVKLTLDFMPTFSLQRQ